MIEKRYPGTQVEWKVLASGTPITNGVIAGQIEIGAVGVGPMLVGWARGVNWKIIAPLNDGDLWLMAKDPAHQDDRRPQGQEDRDADEHVDPGRHAAEDGAGEARRLEGARLGPHRRWTTRTG